LGTEILSAIETETTEKATVFLKEEDAVVWQIAERDVSSLLERSHRKEGLGKGSRPFPPPYTDNKKPLPFSVASKAFYTRQALFVRR